jgi:hypothetical protein
MTAKSKDPLDKAELRALEMRKSKKQELVSKRRGLFGNKTPKERSVSPMFGEATQVNPGVGSLYENDALAYEELKQGPPTSGGSPSHTRTLNEGAFNYPFSTSGA